MEIVLFGKHHGHDGPTRYHRGLARALSDHGHGVKMIGYGNREQPPKEEITLEPISIPDRSVMAWRSFFRNVRQRVSKSDFDLFHSLERYPYPADVRTVHWTSDPYIVWRRAPDVDLNVRTLLGDIVLNWWSRRGTVRANTVIASSPETKWQMERYWRVSPDVVIPYGIPASFRMSPGSVPDRPRVSVIGRLEKRKGQDQILPHLSPNDPRYTLELIGGVADEAYAERTLAEGWREHHIGKVTGEDLERKYENSDIVVIPSYLENFSYVALEAIAKGCTVILTKGCGFAQFDWATKENGIYVADDGEEAAMLLEMLVTDQTLGDQKQAAFEVSARFEWKEIINQYLELYDQVNPR